MNPIQRYCGSGAWQVIFRVLKDTTQTLMPGCHFQSLSMINNSDNLHPASIELMGNNDRREGDLSKTNRRTDGHHHRKQVHYSTNYPNFYENNNNRRREKTTISPITSFSMQQ